MLALSSITSCSTYMERAAGEHSLPGLSECQSKICTMLVQLSLIRHHHLCLAKWTPCQIVLVAYIIASLPDRCHAVQALQDLISKCLSKDPMDRPSAAELLRHRFWKVRFRSDLNKCTTPGRSTCHRVLSVSSSVAAKRIWPGSLIYLVAGSQAQCQM